MALATGALKALDSDPVGNAAAALVEAGYRQTQGTQQLERGVVHYFMRPRRQGRTYELSVARCHDASDGSGLPSTNKTIGSLASMR